MTLNIVYLFYFYWLYTYIFNLEFSSSIDEVRKVKVLNVVARNEVWINLSDKVGPFLLKWG